jgi:hypothetical protein
MSNEIELKHRDITDKILHAYFKIVYPQLGFGFLEKVYEKISAFSAFIRVPLKARPGSIHYRKGKA